MNEDILDDIELLDLMLKDSNNQTRLYKPGPYWKNYCTRTTSAIRYDGLKNFRSNSLIINGYSDALPISPFDLVAPNSWWKKIIRKVVQLRLLERCLYYPYPLPYILKYVDRVTKQNQKLVLGNISYHFIFHYNIMYNYTTNQFKKYLICRNNCLDLLMNLVTLNQNMKKKVID